MKQCWPAPERNKAPILEVLRRVLPSSGVVLEIASGTGQHAAYFAEHLPALEFLPTDIDPQNVASITAWVREAGLANLRAPRTLDVRQGDWGVGTIDAVFNANMIHIAPWAAAVALFQGAGRHLRRGGRVVLYGPFRIGGTHTAPSNAAFDDDLRRRDAEWGVRELDDVVAVAEQAQLVLVERAPMPANNQCITFERQ